MMQKRGTMIKYKNIEAEEAEDFWNFLTVLDKETDCMMYEPGERAIRSSLEELKEDIFSNVIHGEDFLCIALDDGRIVGYLRAERGKCNRIRHMAYIVTGILKSYRERGIGTAFFQGWINGPKKIRFTGWNYPLNVQMKRQDICMKEAAFPSKESEKVPCM